jgi:putative flavoprotein involved in K+ transport
MQRTDVVVVGAGQAGLAMSHELAALRIDHVLIERSRVAERWRTTSWDSLRLVTPNWMTRLPGWRYRGNDPDGFMGRDAIIRFLEAYAGAMAAPVIDNSPVSSVQFAGRQYRVTAVRGTWDARAVVFATGHCDAPYRPAGANALAMSVGQIHSSEYRNPASLPVGNILVVGASASGAQIALELALAGRSVSLADGRHTPVPRSLFGHDVFWWLDRMGRLDERADSFANLEAIRRQPALQVASRIDGRGVDPASLQAAGVRLLGRFIGAHDTAVWLKHDLGTVVRHAEGKRERLIREIAAFAMRANLPAGAAPIPARAWDLDGAPEYLDLRREKISTIIWATGFRRDFSWLGLPVAQPDGDLFHRNGVVPLQGLYALGFRVLR